MCFVTRVAQFFAVTNYRRSDLQVITENLSEGQLNQDLLASPKL